MELKVIFLEIVYLDLYSDKVWGISIFSFSTAPGDIYGRSLLSWHNPRTLSGTRQVCRFLFLFFFFCLFCSLYKTNRFHVAVGLFVSNRSQRTSKCGKKHQWFARLRLVCHFADLLLNRRMATWNLFVKGITKCDDYKFATVHTLSSFMPGCYILSKKAKTQFRPWKRKLKK